jgi:predicted transcriptional regulator of viral defense system
MGLIILSKGDAGMERDLEAYVSREVMKLYGSHKLVAANEVLPGQIEIDFHLKDEEDVDVFVEVSSRKIERSMLSKILNLYSSISNIEPPLGKFKLVIIGRTVASSMKRELERFPIRLLAFKDLGITQGKLRNIGEAERRLRVRRLSPEEARLVTKWETEKRTIVRPRDVQRALKCTLDYAYVLLHNLERKKWLERIDKGIYQFVPATYGYPEKVPPANAFAVGGAFVQPYYFSYYTSNSHYGFTTQMPFTLFIATTKKKPNVAWQSTTFQFVTLSKHKFFGYRTERVFGVDVCMAEPEKSLVDSFDKPRYAGGTEQLARIVWRGLARVDQTKLVDYALRMESSSLVQRLGFIVDFLEKKDLVKPISTELLDRLLRHVGKTPIYLDQRRARSGSFVNEWNVVDNVPENQLLSEIEVR